MMMANALRFDYRRAAIAALFVSARKRSSAYVRWIYKDLFDGMGSFADYWRETLLSTYVLSTAINHDVDVAMRNHSDNL